MILALQIAGGILLALLVVALLPFILANLGRVFGLLCAVGVLAYVWVKLAGG